MMDFEAAQDAISVPGPKRLVERTGRMTGQVVQHDPDPVSDGIMNIDEVAHAVGEVESRAPVGDLDLAPGAMGVDEDEQSGCSIAPLLVVITLRPARCGRDKLTRLADELHRALVEADHGPFRIGILGVKVEHVLHAGHVGAVDLGHASYVASPGLEGVLGQAPAHRHP